jgi:uncharacterized protein YodC (DUF2158 family)
MAFEPGDVVFLKSGGSPMTVAAVGGDSVDCLWLGEEGDLFREAIPTVALMIAADSADEEDHDEDNHDEDDEDKSARDEADLEQADEDEVKPAKSKRKTG